jgi:putative redox protein
MAKILAEYDGDLQCRVIHELTETVIYTDAPLDINGKGRTFSPTDLVAGALASCIATTIALYAERKQWDVKGMRVTVEKEMTQAPERRIVRMQVEVWMHTNLTNEQRHSCERVAALCPVHKSLHPGIEVTIRFHWPPHQ